MRLPLVALFLTGLLLSMSFPLVGAVGTRDIPVGFGGRFTPSDCPANELDCLLPSAGVHDGKGDCALAPAGFYHQASQVSVNCDYWSCNYGAGTSCVGYCDTPSERATNRCIAQPCLLWVNPGRQPGNHCLSGSITVEGVPPVYKPCSGATGVHCSYWSCKDPATGTPKEGSGCVPPCPGHATWQDQCIQERCEVWVEQPTVVAVTGQPCVVSGLL